MPGESFQSREQGVTQSGELAGSVGEDEQAVPSVGGSHSGRGKHCPFRIEPEVGKVGEHLVEAEGEVAPDILEEGEGCTGGADDAEDVGPEVAGIVGSVAKADLGEGPARVAAEDEVDGPGH